MSGSRKKARLDRAGRAGEGWEGARALTAPSPRALQMRPGRLELSADGAALEVHYEVRGDGHPAAAAAAAAHLPPALNCQCACRRLWRWPCSPTAGKLRGAAGQA